MIVHHEDACVCAKPASSGRQYMNFGVQCRLCGKIIISEVDRVRLCDTAEQNRISDLRRNRKRAKGGLPLEGPTSGELHTTRYTLEDWHRDRRASDPPAEG